MIIVCGNLVYAQLHHANKRRDESTELQICELRNTVRHVATLQSLGAYLFPNTPVLSCTEWLVGALCALAHSTETIVNLLAVFVSVHLVSLCRNTLGVVPAVWVPVLTRLPYGGINLADSGGCHDEVPFGDNVNAVFRRCRKGGGDRDVVADVAHDAVNRRVDTESLADDGVEDR